MQQELNTNQTYNFIWLDYKYKKKIKDNKYEKG